MIFHIHVITKTSKTSIVDWDGDKLMIRLNAHPFENLANIALVVFLSDVFDVPKTSITIKRGHHSNDKQVDIPVTPAQVKAISKRYKI